jgi:hypothetical protein
MNPQDLRNLQESYLEIYEDSMIHTNPNHLAQKMGARLKRETKRNPEAADKKTKQYLDTIETLRRRASSGAEPSKYFGRGYAMGVRKEDLEFILDYLLDEGFATTLESAEVILENMSEGWIESIMEEKKPYPVDKVDAKVKELKKKLLATNSSNERGTLTHRLGILLGTRDKKVLEF